ncbi:unnamed protein product [Rotaria sp. Silwood2]|nr:unnamed protein product [Rotaria sp. Silwood2]CAF2950783.1 unnamed protein product [Rotaria sp. Silwood2]CAF4114114.1 unnamed protein product [Rotaria sp. Silwood2]CAF4148621.1 unnamed protein product [Rotaria sp. Silwood2]
MSNNKSPSNQNSSIPNDNEFNYQITNDLSIKINDIIRNNNYRLFFDENLSYDQLMFLLNNRSSIESGLIDFIIEQIHQLIPDENIRQVFLTNINRFAGHLHMVNSDTQVIRHLVFYPDDEDDDYDEETTSDDDSMFDDILDDIENELLDELEFEHFVVVSRYCPGG